VASGAAPAIRALQSRTVIWLLLAAPGIYWLAGYWRETLFYGEVVHATGVFAVQLLIATLALTPLRRILPRARWLGWLRQRRRYLGVAAFGYAMLHALIYFQRQALERILEDLHESAMWTGWLGLCVMLVLAATSNDASVRWLKRRWQLLHRAAYVVALLSFAHWILSAFDPTRAWVYLAVLAGLESLRLVRVAAALRAGRQSGRP
jgi:sulfoxide reductase heme-binding subunit YedZ